MTTPVEPALTPEEWAAVIRTDGGIMPAWVDPQPRNEDAEVVAIAQARLRGRVALALHESQIEGEPIITWGDVELIREGADAIYADATDHGDMKQIDEAQVRRERGHALADRIAALLPPGEKP